MTRVRAAVSQGLMIFRKELGTPEAPGVFLLERLDGLGKLLLDDLSLRALIILREVRANVSKIHRIRSREEQGSENINFLHEEASK